MTNEKLETAYSELPNAFSTSEVHVKLRDGLITYAVDASVFP